MTLVIIYIFALSSDSCYCNFMVGKSHQLVGFASVYSLALFSGVVTLNIQTILASIVLISIGSLTPDLDNPDNKLYTLIPIGSKLFSEVGEKAFGKHRSISHSIIGLVVFGYISHWLMYKIPVANNFNLQALWLSFFVALISHLAADSLTKEGIPLFWPIKYRFGFPPFKALRMKTGGFTEIYIVIPLIIVFLLVLSYFKFTALREIVPFF